MKLTQADLKRGNRICRMLFPYRSWGCFCFAGDAIAKRETSGRVKAGLLTVENLLMFSFDLQAYQISGLRARARSDRFDIEAIAARFFIA